MGVSVRRCEICGSSDLEKLHEQRFLVPDLEGALSYSVNACRSCGFVFAGDIPSQKQYDRYYKVNTKYTYSMYSDSVPKGLKEIHRRSCRIIDSFLQCRTPPIEKAGLRILDIGASSGYLLHLLKKTGYTRVEGIDPSSECCVIGKNLYGVDIAPCALSEFRPQGKYDMVLLSGVLEHVSEVRSFLHTVHSLLKENGVLFALVPDADNFARDPKEPYHEFSVEHINFFSRGSMKNLMERSGFSIHELQTVDAGFYDTHCLVGFFRKANVAEPRVRDHAGPDRIRMYISASRRKMDCISKIIRELVESREDLIVWGCGALTSRLLAVTDLGKANLVAFVDGNRNLQGRRLCGIEIVPPDYMAGKDSTVLIASVVYGEEIRDTLLNSYRYTGRIIRL
jgi:SAM-dependent methyltransferase